jgi:hypothetical protein
MDELESFGDEKGISIGWRRLVGIQNWAGPKRSSLRASAFCSPEGTRIPQQPVEKVRGLPFSSKRLDGSARRPAHTLCGL